MIADRSNRLIIRHVQIPERWVLLLLAVVLLAFMAISALLNDRGNADATEDSVSGAIAQIDVQTATEANGSIDPFAPFFGDGGMIEQSVVFFNEDAYGQQAYSACFLGISCRPW